MKHIPQKKGAAVITSVILLLGISIILIGTSSRLVVGEAGRSFSYNDSQERYRLAESAAEDVAYRLKKGYTIQPIENVIVGSSTIPIALSVLGGLNVITATSTTSYSTRAVGLSVFKGTGVDFFYGIHAGTSGMTLSSSATVNGNVFSGGNIVGFSNSRITGSATAVGTISSPNPTVNGTKTAGAPNQPFPEFDAVYWKEQANINNDPYVGNLQYNGSSVATLGPKKIQGNLSLNSSSKVTLLGPIHVTGNLELNSSSELILDSSFGSQGTVVVVDGTIRVNSSAKVRATNANPKGYVLLVSLATGTAIELNSSSSTDSLVYALNGNVQLNSSAKATAVTGKGINLNSSASITYDLGLADATFSSGPSGGWEIEGWGETQ